MQINNTEIIAYFKRFPKGITDISPEEGELTRLSKICKLIYRQQKPLARDELFQLIKKGRLQLIKKDRGLENEKVIGRHIRILEVLKILQRIEGKYILSSHGEVLSEFTEEKDKLNLYEKIFYLRSFLNEKRLLPQLYLLLYTANGNKDKSRDDIIIEYFKNVLEWRLNLWKREIIQTNLKRTRTNNIPSFLKNKFGCIEKWLWHLNLVEKRGNLLKLSSNGEKFVLNIHEFFREIEDKSYEISSILIQNTPSKFEYGRDKEHLLDLLEESYKKFKRPDIDIADLRAMKSWICTKFLADSHIILEEKKFDSLLNTLIEEKVVRSVMVGRDGKISRIILNQ